MKQFFKANAASLIASSCDFLVAVIMKELLSMDAVVASITGTVAGGIINFIICRFWAFNAAGMPVFTQGKRYFIAWCGNLLLNAAGAYVLIRSLDVEYKIAKIATSILVAVAYNYPLQKKYVFKDNLVNNENGKDN
jgi:putative flippase GtrA